MSDKMKAVVMRGPNQYGVEQVDIPRPGCKEVLVGIKAVAICGSDPKVFSGGYLNIHWPPAFPFIPGHEFAGEVVALGEGVTEFNPGDRVAGEAHCGCGTCANCKAGHYNLCLNYGKAVVGHRHYGFTSQGAYAQYNAYHVKALTLLPDNISFEEGSLVDTAGTAYQAIRLAGITPGGYSVTFGPGPIGIFTMQIAKSMGSRTIMVGRRERLQAARRLGADHVVDYEGGKDVVAVVREITGGIGADEVFECAGTQEAVIQSVRCAKKNGHVAFVALPTTDEMRIPVKTMVMNQIAVHGSRANPNCSAKVLELMAGGRINAKEMITHRFAIDEIHP
ncbi:MAG: zinc-binding dehydrogenase, partial [Deltaproteobacteria bacterium]|nr:zinc-binding dehydrogenase [Deltaproteobacteria bacterium]